jgi:phosphoribosylformimino-5-aminoimidazole carboxamide ribotide isomerase
MEIIPAMDLRERRLVRLMQGRYEQETVYSDDPVTVAKHWEEQGATRLHVVDLDGARLGVPQNLDVVRAIVEGVRIPVQFGGGIRSESTIEKVLAMGVDRVIIGTSAVSDNVFLRNALDRYAEQIIISVDANDGKVATRGWTEVTEILSIAFAQEMERLGAQRLIFTDISRDGMLSGPNLERLKEVAESVYIPVLASGGISRLSHIRAVKDIEAEGIEGIIIGTALYTGTISLKDCIAAVSAQKVEEMSPEEIRRVETLALLRLSEELHESALFCQDHHRWRAAADLAGGSIITAARGLIVLCGDKPPQTSSEMMARFNDLYVKTGELPAEMGSKLEDAIRIRLLASSDPHVVFGAYEVGIVTDAAQELIEELRRKTAA